MKKFIIINKKRVFISRKKYNLLKIIDNRYYYTKKLDQKNKLIHFSSYDTERLFTNDEATILEGIKYLKN